MIKKINIVPMFGPDDPSLAAAEFLLHRISNFPIVRFENGSACEGFAVQWATEMEQLLARKMPFVVVVPSSQRLESRVDWEKRVIWMKKHKNELSLYCRGLISIQPEPVPGDDLGRLVSGSKRLFGVVQHVVRNEAEATMLAHRILSKTNIATEALRILSLRAKYER